MKMSEIEHYFKVRNSLTIQNYCIWWGNRIVIPHKIRSDCLALLHEQHWGISKMLNTVKDVLWWPLIERDVKEHVMNCNTCNVMLKRLNKNSYRPWPLSK